MADSKHKAVWDWLLTCPYIGDLFFNASNGEDGNTQLIPSDKIIQNYIDGSSLRHYDCALTRFLGYSADPNDEANLVQAVDFDKIAEWIEVQLDLGNVPAFPAGHRLTDISVLPNQSGYMVSQDMTLAKYMIQFQIEYIRDRMTPTASGSGDGDTDNN